MNFVCVVFELGDKMLTLSSMENLIVPCNLKYAVCPVLVRSASCRYPVCIRLCPFDLGYERSTTGHVKRLKRSSPDEYRMLNGRAPDKERIKRSNNG